MRSIGRPITETGFDLPVNTLLRTVAVSLAFAGVSLFGAACGPEVAAGYAGPYPSATAQEALHALAGRALPPGTLAAENAPLEIVSFGIVPNPVTGKGPVVRLRETARPLTQSAPNAPQGADGNWYLPVQTDGDAADLVQRATGSVPLNFAGETSATYRAALGLDER